MIRIAGICSCRYCGMTDKGADEIVTTPSVGDGQMEPATLQPLRK